MLTMIGLAGVAMLIAALVRPFRRASEATPFEEAAATSEADRELTEIERKE